MKKLSVLGILSLVLFVGLVFQNCSSPVGFEVSSSEVNPFGTGGTRKISVNPHDKSLRPPIHLNSIVDNSYSTTEIQNNLIEGFTRAIDQVRDFNVLASIYTTTNTAGEDKNSTVVDSLVSYQDSQGKTVTLPLSDIALVPENTNYVEKNIYRIAQSLTPDQRALEYQQGKDNFFAFKKAYSDSVAALGVDGADDETGLCTLLRKVEENAQISDPQKRAYHIYILASNENDYTSLENCPLEILKETVYEPETKTVNCAAGDVGCRFDYQVQQSPDSSSRLSLQFSRPSATVKQTYKATRIDERYTYANSVFTHGISYQKRQAKFDYRVVKYCNRDNIIEPCSSNETRSRTLTAGCSATGTRACNSSDDGNLQNLFGVRSADLASCQVTCSESYVSETLPVNLIPNRVNSCSVASRVCDGTDLTAVATRIAAGTDNIRNCQRSCSSSTSASKSKTYYNRLTSCPAGASSRACTSQEISSIAAPALGVDSSLVSSCQYSCSATALNSSRNLATKLTCENGDNRECNSADRTSLASSIKVAESAIQMCSVSCTETQKSEVYIYSGDQKTYCSSAPALADCNNEQKQVAAQFFKGSVNQVSSCKAKCESSPVARPACVISSSDDANLCSNSAKITSQCQTLGFANPVTSQCQQTAAKRSTTTYKKKDGATQVVTLQDLPNLKGETRLPYIVAQRMKEAHGQQGFAYSAFVYPSADPSCVAPGHLSVGERYEELAYALGPDLGQTFPLCVTDYSPALDSLLKVAIESVMTTINLDLELTESVYEIYGIYEDGEKKLIPTTEYQAFKNSVKFRNRNVLKDVVELEISVWKP